MSDHITAANAERLRSGKLPPAEIAAIGRHITGCRECRELVEAAVRVDDAVNDVRSQFEEEVDRRGRLSPHWAAIAAGVIIAIAALALWRRTPPTAPAHVITVTTPTPPEHGRWNDLVTKTVACGTLPTPAILGDLRERSPQFRGAAASSTVSLSPNAAIVEETTPVLRWTPRSGARCIVILSDGSHVTKHDAGETAAWRVGEPLRRGAEYQWQVEMRKGSEVEVHPTAPQRPARFLVLDERAAAELAEARRAYPNDHLLLGVLLARHGLVDDARRELELLRATDPALADKLLKSL